MDIVVVSDTHIRSGGRRVLPEAVLAAAGRADLVLHAGDIVVPEVLDELARLAPVEAVLGNNDVPALADVLPEELVLDLEGAKVAMVHDSGPSKARPGRMRRRFPDADLVVFGHSHIPMVLDGVDGQVLLNPGSPTERRRQPVHTYATVTITDGQVTAELVEL